MPLKTADSQDAIPEPLRANAFETKDGKWVFDEPEDTTALKTALQKERQARADAEKKAKEAADQAEAARLKEQGLEAAKKEWDEKHLKPVSEKLTQLEQENTALKLVGPVKSLFGKIGMIDPDDAWQILGTQFVLGDSGKPVLKDNPTADLEKYLTTEVKKAKPWLFRASQGAGGDAGGGKGGGAPSGIDPLKDPQGALNAARAAA